MSNANAGSMQILDVYVIQQGQIYIIRSKFLQDRAPFPNWDQIVTKNYFCNPLNLWMDIHIEFTCMFNLEPLPWVL